MQHLSLVHQKSGYSCERIPRRLGHVRWRLLFALYAIFCVGLLSTHSLQAQNFQLIFEDEFNGNAVDETKWEFMLGDGTEFGIPGWGNNELQFYRRENTTVAEGMLTITAKEEFFGGYNYTSSRLRTANLADFKYGRFEMRAKLPTTQGMWPAFWLLFTDPNAYGGWAASGEIDIMENIGSQPRRVFATIHYGEPFPGNRSTERDIELEEDELAFFEKFHEFALEWEPGEIRWYLDGQLYATQNDWYSNGGAYPAPFDQKFHMLINLAVGGNFPGPPDGSTVLPQEYVIDYIRVYEDVELPQAAITSIMPNENFAAGSDIELLAEVTTPNGLDRVEFYQGDLKLGESTSAPHTMTVSNAAEGDYRVRAVVYDQNGKRNYSDFINFSVGNGGQGPYGITATPIPGIIEAENFDNGGQGEAYNDTNPEVNNASPTPGNRYRNDEGVDIEATQDVEGGQNISFINAGEWLEYTVDVAETGLYDFEFRVASNTNPGLLNLEVNGQDLSGPVSFQPTGGFQSWTSIIKEDIPMQAGIQTLRLNFQTTGMNVNRISIQNADASSGQKVVFDDMEHGDPINNGWFTFGSDIGGGGIDANASDLPPANAGNFSLQTGWGSGGTPGFLGGFGRRNEVDLSQATFFNMWINPDADQDYTLEINLQEDENANGTFEPGIDDEYRYSLSVAPSGAQVNSGGGWQLVSIPLSDFVAINSATGLGVGDFLNVVIAVISNSGADVTFRTDYWSFTNGPLGAEINATPNPFAYPPTAAGNTAFRIFQVQNEGCSDLEITGFELAGANADEFNIESTETNLTILPGGFFNLLVSFNPTSVGEKTAEVLVSSNDSDEGTFPIQVSGTATEPSAINKVIFDDLEHGDPATNGWETFDGAATGGVTINNTDLPPEDGGQFSLEVSWPTGGSSGFYGGFLRTNPVDLTGMTHFNMWINPDAGQDYLLEINLQDDDNGDSQIPFPSPDDDEFQYNFMVNSTDGDAIAGGGWQLVSIPLSDFFDDNSIHTGNGVFDPFPVTSGGNGQLINVVVAIISNTATDVSFRTDLWCFSEGPLGVTDPVIGVSPASLNFGPSSPGLSKSLDLTVSNEGGAPLEISSIEITGADAADFSVSEPTPTTIDIVGSAIVQVNFNASGVGPKVAQLVINSNDPNNPSLTIDLVGEGANQGKVVFDDLEHGDPFNNGWFTFGGAVGGGGIDPNGADLAPLNSGSVGLQTGWGSGGTPGFLGGFGRTNPVDLSGMTHFNFWINPDAGQDYMLEINLQEDDDGDNAFPFPAPADDEFQYNLSVGPEGSGAEVISGGGWQLVSLPLSEFFDDNSIHGGNGIFDPFSVANGGNGQLIGIVFGVISNSGADATFRTDFWCFSEGPVKAKNLYEDMEHGDPANNGWFAFGGAVGGGGFDPNFTDLPPVDGGTATVQTGWGSGGTPGFLGGFGLNKTAHLSSDFTHFNMWINPNADQDYILEINLQEDDNGDGAFPFPAPEDDEFQYNLTVGPASSGAEVIAGGGWQLVSIPFTDFFDDNSIHGGNGVFDPVPVNSGGNGELIGIVFTVISNTGADVNFRTDNWCFSDGPVVPKLVYEDMEHGDPFNNGWFTFGGAVGGGGLDANFGDLPPENGGDASIQTGWGSGGTPGFFGGFGINKTAHLAGFTHFNMWINPDADQDYLLEINLQEDDNGDGAFPFPAPDDDEFQYNLTVGPAGSGAEVIAGGGWQLVSIPFTDFFDDNSIHGGNGVFDPFPTSSGGNGELISIVFAVISNSGADVNFRTDFWCFSQGSLLPAEPDFRLVEIVGGQPLEIAKIFDGETIVVEDLDNRRLAIEALIEETGSVRMDLDGPFSYAKTENIAPYSSFGDFQGTWTGFKLPAGDYQMKATPYSAANLKGDMGETRMASFTLQSSTSDVQSVSEFLLYNAATDEIIGRIEEGAEFQIPANDPFPVGIVALTAPRQVGSVRMSLSGPVSAGRTEGFAPYSLFTDNGNQDINGMILTPGNYTLSATPFSEKLEGGTEGTSLTVNFSLVEVSLLSIQPNPVTTDLSINPSVTGNLIVMDAFGNVIREMKVHVGQKQILDMSNLDRGTYLLRFVSEEGETDTQKVMKY